MGERETAVFHSTLYQLETDSGPQNQLVGGHGFTGLNYSYTISFCSSGVMGCSSVMVTIFPDVDCTVGGVVLTCVAWLA